MKEFLVKHKQYLLIRVLFSIPFITYSSILIAATIAFTLIMATGSNFSNIGMALFKQTLPVLAGGIAYAIAGKPCLFAGFIEGYLSEEINDWFPWSVRNKIRQTNSFFERN